MLTSAVFGTHKRSLMNKITNSSFKKLKSSLRFVVLKVLFSDLKPQRKVPEW